MERKEHLKCLVIGLGALATVLAVGCGGEPTRPTTEALAPPLGTNGPDRPGSAAARGGAGERYQLASEQQTSVDLDPAGDTEFGAPGFQDIVRAEVSKEGDEFVLRMEMAATIPVNPPLPAPAVHEIWWMWAIDLDRTTTPAGYPCAPGCTLPSEIHACVRWDGSSFHGIVIDRRPLLNGGQATILTVPFSVQGATLELHVPSAVIGNPSSFRWPTVTTDWSGPVGSGGFHFVDHGSPPGQAPTWP